MHYIVTHNSLKAIMFTVMNYFKGRIQTRIGHEKRYIKQSPEEVPNAELLLSSPQGVITILVINWDNTNGSLITRKAYLSLGNQQFYCGFIT